MAHTSVKCHAHAFDTPEHPLAVTRTTTTTRCTPLSQTANPRPAAVWLCVCLFAANPNSERKKGTRRDATAASVAACIPSTQRSTPPAAAVATSAVSMCPMPGAATPKLTVYLPGMAVRVPSSAAGANSVSAG